jgi:hypothetical protein
LNYQKNGGRKNKMKLLNIRLDDKHEVMLQDVKNAIAAEMHIEPDSITDSDIMRWALANFHHFKTAK